MKVVKRDGKLDSYSPTKVLDAVGAAMQEVEGFVDTKCAKEIEATVRRKLKEEGELDVEQIQDICEIGLMQHYPHIAKAYILYRDKKTQERNREWEMNELQRDIYEQKYKYEDESFEEFLDRVSDGDQFIKEVIRKKEFMPAGRILAGMDLYNRGKKVTLSNCYVMPKVSDNIESIFDTAKYLARTYSYGGGVGLAISNLRPKGAKVNNAANTTTGAVSFMELYSLVTTLIGMRGRRGALMLNIDVSHPDIEDFIDIKNDLDKVTGANISVNITDDFMEAVKNDTLYRLHFTADATGEVIERNVRARELFKKLAQNNWNMAEPGVLYQDRIDSWHLMSEDKEFEFAGVNPCFTGDMELLTKDGFMRFDELNGDKVELVTINGDISEGEVWESGIKDTVRVRLSNGQIMKSTPDHVFMDIDGSEVEAKDLKGVKIMPQLSEYKEYNDKYIKYGFIQGDGQLTRLRSETHKGIEVLIGEDDGDVYELFADDEYTETNKIGIYLQGDYKQEMIELGFSSEALPERGFPSTYDEWTNIEKASFLQGMFSANGSVTTGHRVSYKTTCRELADKIKETLYEDFGIHSNITINKEKKVQFSNGEYLCKESYDVNINRYESQLAFSREVNFYHRYKKDMLRELLIQRAPYVTSIVDNGSEMVYDFNEPEHNWGIVNGYIAHNCAEETLPAFGSCNLSSINLSELVRNPYTDEASFDKERFEKLTRAGVRYLNHVLDINMELHPLEQQREMSRDYRQIGLVI